MFVALVLLIWLVLMVLFSAVWPTPVGGGWGGYVYLRLPPRHRLLFNIIVCDVVTGDFVCDLYGCDVVTVSHCVCDSDSVTV